jgi:hypothetical protein
MRKIVIAEALSLIVFGLYMAIGMSIASQPERHAAHPHAGAHQEPMR